VEAVLGVDIPAERWLEMVRSRRLGLIAVLAVMETSLVFFLCLILVLRASIAKRQRAQHRLRCLQRHLEHQVEERSQALVEAQRQAMRSEKLASLGQLAAGVAHEINTPIQYVGDNLRALADFVRELVGLTDQYRELVQLVKEGGPASDLVGHIEQAEAHADLNYIRVDAPKAVVQGLDGVQRVAHIVKAMKDFSHPNRDQVTPLEVNAVLARALTLSHNEYKYVADVVTDFADVPAIEGYGAELSQVFLNLIVNAGHAIGDTGQRGKITVRTRCQGEHIEVAIADTGTGIPTEIQGRIFDPFFTTKPVGKGTGQGLSIVHQIVQQHQGTIRFDTQVGQGTTFYIRLPLRQKPSQQP
jgi:signal transduction histidine kinase